MTERYKIRMKKIDILMEKMKKNKEKVIKIMVSTEGNLSTQE